jgi:SAM-dependent methyltransferase
VNENTEKYNRVAGNFSRNEYSNLEYYMQRRFRIATGWGRKLDPGNSVLEIGCGDGYLARIFVDNGFHYSGIDASANMIRETRARLMGFESPAELWVGDANDPMLTGGYDAVVAYMRSFFGYVKDPLSSLKKIKPHVKKKIIVDLNPRLGTSVEEAVRTLREAGFRKVEWRPFLVPQNRRLPFTVLEILTAIESVPILRRIPLHWKFHVLLKGEVK